MSLEPIPFTDEQLRRLSRMQFPDGQYVWDAGLRAGEPDTVCDYPIRVAEAGEETPQFETWADVVRIVRRYQEEELRKVADSTEDHEAFADRVESLLSTFPEESS